MLNLIIIVLILAIVFVQALHGLFSSLIMALCTLVCTVMAFNYYEQVAAMLVQYQPAYMESICLVVLTAIPLFAVRFCVDNYLPGNLAPSMWVDRAGGAAFGLITGALLTGTLLVAMQMMPFDRGFLGFDPYDDNLEPATDLVVNTPGFTLGVVRALSGGSLSGSRSFAQAHDDLTLELWANRNRLPGARSDAQPPDFKVKSVGDVTDLPYPGKGPTDTFGVFAPDYRGSGAEDSMVYVVRVDVAAAAADTDRWWRLMGTHFRLVTAEGEGVYPVGYMINVGEWQIFTEQIGKLQINRPAPKGKSWLTLDLLFRVPMTDAGKPAKLAHMSFRRVAHSALPRIQEQMPPVVGSLARKEVFGEVDVKGPGTLTLFRARKAVVNDRLPLQFRTEGGRRSERNVDIVRNGARAKGVTLHEHMISGVIKGPVQGLLQPIASGRGQSGTIVERFNQPAGKKIVKLQGDALVSEMFLGKLASAAVQPAMLMIDGSEEPVLGAWVLWTENGTAMGHMYFAPDREEFAEFRMTPGQGIMDVIDTYKQHRKVVTEFGLVFMTGEGGKAAAFRVKGREVFHCESPLSTGARPRARRRRR